MGWKDRFDGWMNNLTGLGGVRDKVMHYTFGASVRISDDELESMYDGDDMAARIADSVPEHMLRRGFLVTTKDTPKAGPDAIEYLEERNFLAALTEAMVWERVFGGGACVLGFDDGLLPQEPLDENHIRSLRFVNVLDKRDLFPVFWYTDPMQPNFGKPSHYRINYYVQGTAAPNSEESARNVQRSVIVHESRMLVFSGGRTTRRNKLRYNGWGTSVLGRCYGPLRSFNANWQSVENLMQDASQGVYKIKGLLEVISSGNKEPLTKRMEILDISRSVARAILVDADTEEFERKDTSMSGLPELLDRTMTRLASAAKSPVTVLMGTSPAGLNATGASDIRGWYDTLEAERTQKLARPLQRVVRLVFLCKDGPTGGVVPEFTIGFPSLWQETEAEKAATAATKTQSDTALIQAGVVTAEEVAIRRAEELQIDPNPRLAVVSADLQALVTPGKPEENNGESKP